MLACINISSPEYQTLLSRSGLNRDILEAICRKYITKYDRFPYLDELPNADSTSALNKHLNIRKSGSAKVTDILNATGTESIQDAVISLNNEFRDLETSIIELGETAIVNTEKRPSVYNVEEFTPVEYEEVNQNSAVALNHALNRLAKLYGIQMIPVTTKDLMSEEWKDIVLDAKNVNAFVYNGNIYINTDHARIDSPLHEMMHIFLGSMRYSNPELYSQLIEYATQFSNYEQLVQDYPNRTRNDINEEIFIHEFANFAVGNESEFDNIDEATLYEMTYNINRVLDSVLMGKDSVKMISDGDKMKMSLEELAEAVNSTAFQNKFKGSLTDAQVHRIMANTKSDLMKQGLLEEQCE